MLYVMYCLQENNTAAATDEKLWDSRSMTSEMLRSRINSITSVRSAGLDGVGQKGDDGQMSPSQMNDIKF